MILSWNALAMSDMGVMLATTDHEVRTSRKAMAPTEKLTLVYNAGLAYLSTNNGTRHGGYDADAPEQCHNRPSPTKPSTSLL